MSLLCASCKVYFDGETEMRDHFKSTWHTYNMKRKLCNLPIVSKESFLANEAVVKRESNQEPKASTKDYCSVCSKCFSTKNAYNNHLKSNNHLTKVKQHPAGAEALSRSQSQTSRSEQMDEDEDEDEALGLEQCFFCSNIGKSLTKSLKHMAAEHSFFIPDVEYLVDLEGLVAHIGEKIGVGHMCLWCNDASKMFYTIDAVQKHMRDKGHCKLKYDGDATLEYADFYDYSSSWPAGEEVDEDVEEPEEAPEEGFELTLPSGAVIGHRSLLRYYKQKLPPTRDLVLHQSRLNVVLSQYKAIGWRGEGAVSRQRHQDMAFLQRNKLKHHMQLGVKANKFQKYFRPQVIF